MIRLVMTEGDLTKKIDYDSSDEFGMLIDGFNRMSGYLSELVAQIQNAGIQVTSSITEIAASTKQQEATANEEGGQALVQAGFLRNMLLSTYVYRQDLLEVQTPTEEVGDLMDQFLRLPSPTAAPSPPDMALTYQKAPLDQVDGEAVATTWVEMTLLDGEDPVDLLYAEEDYVVVNGTSLDRPEPGNAAFGVALLD